MRMATRKRPVSRSRSPARLGDVGGLERALMRRSSRLDTIKATTALLVAIAALLQAIYPYVKPWLS